MVAKGNNTLREKLIEACRCSVSLSDHVKLPEPYVPYVPTRWTGTLVLGEAQNLADGEYLARLKNLAPRKRVDRLGHLDLCVPPMIGIQPWDDGSLKLAVRVALGIDPKQVAVSNGALWSRVDDQGRNMNPSLEVKRRSSALWKEMLGILQPDRIVTAGRCAQEIVVEAGFTPVAWPLPSPRVLSPIAGYVSETDLLKRYPEVADALVTLGDLKNRRHAILYACLCLSSMGAVNKTQQTQSSPHHTSP